MLLLLRSCAGCCPQPGTACDYAQTLHCAVRAHPEDVAELCSACNHPRKLAGAISPAALQVGPTMRTASAAVAAVRPAQLIAGQPYTITARARDAFDNDLAAAVPYPGFLLGAEFSAALAEPALVDQFGDGATVITYRISRPGEYALQVGHLELTSRECCGRLVRLLPAACRSVCCAVRAVPHAV
jgi:hypothetical protein